MSIVSYLVQNGEKNGHVGVVPDTALAYQQAGRQCSTRCAHASVTAVLQHHSHCQISAPFKKELDTQGGADSETNIPTSLGATHNERVSGV